MPVLIPGESNMIVMPQTYSPATIARRFKIIEELLIRGEMYLIIYDAAAPFAAVIKAEVNGEVRHEAVATLELERRDQYGEVFSVRDFWQNDALQVESIVVGNAMRDVGLATMLYECLVLKEGITLMSDNTHYTGGQVLWKKIARSSEKLIVFVLDTDEGKFYPYDGSRLRYDGLTIPSEAI